VMPRVLPDGLVLFLSTPWAEEGLFWKLASENHGNPTRAIVAKAPTLLMRDNDPELAAAIAAERERDPDNAAREFDAEFMSTGGSIFFESKSITDAVDDNLVLPAARLADEHVGFGADVGLVHDSSALVGIGARARMLRLVTLIEKRPEKKQPLKLSEVVASFAVELRRYDASRFVADGHAREPAREWAAKEQIAIVSRPEGPTAKFDTFVAVREALRDRRLQLPRDARLLAQLRAVTAKPMPGGGWKLTSPRRAGQGHGDLVSALVLAVWAASQGSGRNLLGVSRNPLHRFHPNQRGF